MQTKCKVKYMQLTLVLPKNTCQVMANIFLIKKINLLLELLDTHRLTHIKELSKVEEMIWKAGVMLCCIFYVESYRGKTWKQQTKRTSMKELWKKKNPLPLMNFVKTFQNNSKNIFHIVVTLNLMKNLIIQIAKNN